jgi:four helix bundle protein
VISEHSGGDNRHGRLISSRGILLREECRPMKNFRDLVVWRKAHFLTLKCYQTTNGFPKHELYGITSQMRRCAASIAANIAEGCGKRGNAEFQRFLGIASGSASELENHILLSRDLG